MSNLYRGTKATPSTTCQKCLQRGHYSYECKAPVQSRPYTSRPSRSQQLLNPRLRTQLSNTAPDPTAPSSTSKKGIADQILAQKADERRVKRARSAGSATSDGSESSVATISTGKSRSISRSPPPRRRRRREDSEGHDERADRRGSGGVKRRRSFSSPSVSLSEASREQGQPGGGRGEGQHDARRQVSGGDSERNTRCRRRSTSPGQRGRRHRRDEVPSDDEELDAPVFSQSVSQRGDSREREREAGGYARHRDRDRHRDGAGGGGDSGGGGGGSDRRGPAGHATRELSPYSRRMAMGR